MPRRLGQHFLHDPAILDRIVDALKPTRDDVVVEIGPGRGTLTERLAPRVRHVIAIERDRDLARGLRETAARGDDPPHNVSVLEHDALELNWHGAAEAAAGPVPVSSYKVAGNIPYYITTPLIDRALASPRPAVIVFLVQREVADRLTALPGTKEYGALTVGVQAAATVEPVFRVRKGSFRPPPAVDSAVVRFSPRARPLVEPAEEHDFRLFIAAVFSQRRKQIQRILRNTVHARGDDLDDCLESVGIEPTLRPEAVPVEALVALFRALPR